MSDYLKEPWLVDKNKYFKTWSTSLAIREILIKTTLRFHLATVRMAIIKKISNKF